MRTIQTKQTVGNRVEKKPCYIMKNKSLDTTRNEYMLFDVDGNYISSFTATASGANTWAQTQGLETTSPIAIYNLRKDRKQP